MTDSDQDKKKGKPRGKYGSGVRDQVFEVIVRQGMVGAPWREICAGPMQVNAIDPEDVQAEIDRRTGEKGGQAGAPVPKKPKPFLGGVFSGLFKERTKRDR